MLGVLHLAGCLISYAMGYLRGHGAGFRAVSECWDQARLARLQKGLPL